MNDYNKIVIDTYDKIANDYNSAFSDSLSEIKYIDIFLQSLSGKNVLDLGCGVGNFTNYIYSKGYDVLGVDLSKNMLKIAKDKFPKCSFIQNDMRYINNRKKYDGILLADSLFHLTKQEVINTLPIYNKMLNTEGKMLLILQEGCGERLVEEPFDPKLKIFINYYSGNECKDLLEKNMFRILSENKISTSNNKELGCCKLVVLCEKCNN